MSSLENKAIGKLLEVIRSRRSVKEARDSSPTEASARDARGHAKCREVNFADFEAVAALKQRLGLRQDSRENWKRLWVENPAFVDHPARCMGWVLEARGRIVGYLGSIPLRYYYGNEILNTAVASGFAVEPIYRAYSLSLVDAFYRQGNVELFLNTTAIESVGRLVKAFKADPLPQLDYATVLFWVLRSREFAAAVTMKLGFDSKLGELLALATSLVLRADLVIRRRKPRAGVGGLKVSEIGVESIGEEFQNLWVKKLKETPRLLAERSQVALRWHFSIPGSQEKTCVLRCASRTKLLGYAVVRNETDRKVRLRRSVLADLLVAEDDPMVTQQLLVAAYEHAKRSGSHILELWGFPENIRGICLQGTPYLRKYPACPFFYKARDHQLHQTLGNGDAWYACPFDGDTSLMP
jgi:hypothetical protein